MYSLLRPLLFQMDAENAHHLTLSALHHMPSAFFHPPHTSPVTAMGLSFSHRVGLAAGLDKNGDHLDALSKLGFSFIELGTVTPKPQEGNPKPRLFRLPQALAIINRMGFNNKGVDVLVHNIKHSKYQGILGINIGKNKDTSLHQASDDYLYCMNKVYAYASYITINISSPNTPDLRQLQQTAYLDDLLTKLVDRQSQLAEEQQRQVPLLVKISPDENDDTLREMTRVITSKNIQGIIATNTTSSREGVEHLRFGKESGGLSGQPLAKRSTDCLRVIKEVIEDKLVLIGVGGINNRQTAQSKLDAGADLLQVYSGLIYKGPGLVTELSRL